MWVAGDEGLEWLVSVFSGPPVPRQGALVLYARDGGGPEIDLSGLDLEGKGWSGRVMRDNAAAYLSVAAEPHHGIESVWLIGDADELRVLVVEAPKGSPLGELNKSSWREGVERRFQDLSPSAVRVEFWALGEDRRSFAEESAAQDALFARWAD